MGDDATMLGSATCRESRRVEEWTPAPALTDEWVPKGDDMQTSRWDSPCGRLHALVWYNKWSGLFCYLVDGPANTGGRVSVPVGSEAKAKERALEVARGMLAELGAEPAPAPTRAWDEIARSIAATVAEKNAAYGDSFERAGEIIDILYPNGIPRGKTGDALAVVRVLDKLFRIASDRDAFGESPWRDIAGYALLAVEKRERERWK